MAFLGECKECIACLEQCYDTIVLPEEWKTRVIASLFRVGEYITTKEDEAQNYIKRITYTKLDTPHVDATVPENHDNMKIEEYIIPHSDLENIDQVLADKKYSGDYWLNGTFQSSTLTPNTEAIQNFALVINEQIIKDV